PGTAPAHGLRAWEMCRCIIADQPGKGERTMSLLSWLQNLRSALTPARCQRQHRRRGPVRVATHPPTLDVLEDRTVPSTFTVLTPGDSGSGSLRAAVLAAEAHPGPDVIDFARGVQGTITLTGGELLVTSDLAIDGPGANRLTVSGGGASRVFHVVGGADAAGAITVTISGLTVANGRADRGGGVRNEGFSDLTLDRVTVSDSVAVGTSTAGARGGGVFSIG